MPRDPATARSPRSRRPGWRRTPTSTCAAAPAPISAAKNRRCSKASRASAACRGSKPPFPAQVGLFGRPTLCNNVETLYWVRDIVEKGAGMVHRPGPQRPQGAAHLLGVGAGARPRRQARPGRDHRAPADRRILRRHGRGPCLQGLSAGRRLGRHPAGGDGRHPARFRDARKRGLLYRLGRGCRAVGQGRHEGGGAEPACAFSRTRAAASARRAAPAPKRRSS